MKKRFLSGLLMLVMLLTLLPTAALAVEPSSVTCGEFTLSTTDPAGLTGDDYSYADFRLTIKSGKAVTISMKDGVAKTTADRIVVPAGVTANITLDGVNIDVSRTSKSCAFSINSDDAQHTTVNLTLTGDNVLKSSGDCGGLQTSKYSTLTISGSGSLSATGGSCGAGIGGGRSTTADDITAHGGTIIINGGQITAVGGSYASGIGDGDYYEAGDGITSGASVTINGGIVFAQGGGGSDTHDIGRGDDNKTKGLSFSTGGSGNAIIYADDITDQTHKSDWDCILFDLDETEGVVYGDVTLAENLTIGKGQTLTIPTDTKLTVPNGVTLTNNGTLNCVDGTLTNGGTIQNNGTIQLPDGDINDLTAAMGITGGMVIVGGKTYSRIDGKWVQDITHVGLQLSKAESGVAYYAGGGTVTWKPAADGNPGILTLNNVNMGTDSTAFSIDVGGTVRVVATGTNTLTVHGEDARAFDAFSLVATVEVTGGGQLNMVFDAAADSTAIFADRVQLSDVTISENSAYGIDADTILCNGFTVPAGGALKLNGDITAAESAAPSTVYGKIMLRGGVNSSVLGDANVTVSSTGKVIHFLTGGLDLAVLDQLIQEDPEKVNFDELTASEHGLTIAGSHEEGYTLTFYDVEIRGDDYALQLPAEVDVTLVLKGEAALFTFDGYALTDINRGFAQLALSDTTTPALVISGDPAGSLSVTTGGNYGAVGVGLAIHVLDIQSGSVAATATAEDAVAYGIYSTKDITVSGGSVAATATAEDAVAYGIYSTKDITISDAEVTATAEGAAEADGLYSDHGVISITNSTVTVDATATAAHATAIGINVYYDILTITNSTVTVNATAAAQGYASGLYAYYENSEYDSLSADSADSDCLTITNSTVSAIATGDVESEGICADGDCSLAISGSTVRAEGNTHGILAYGTCSLSNSSVTAVNHNTSENISIRADNGLTLASGMIVRQGTLEEADADNIIEQAYGDANGVFTASSFTTDSGSGSSYTYYTITTSAGEGGSVSPSGSVSVREGLDKTFTITTKDGYAISDVLVDGVSVKDKLTGSSYTFENVKKAHTITVTFIENSKSLPYTDLKESDWFYADVMVACENGWFAGTSATTFSPYANMTRQMLWTVLGRVNGETLSGGGVFDAARTWAMTAGITDGSNPTAALTREQFVTILWRYAGSPAASGDLTAFSDAGSVTAYATDAMRWAVENGIVNGTSATTLSPEKSATRAQIAVILARCFSK